MFKLISQLQKMKTPDKINGVVQESGDLSSQGLKFKSDGLQNSNNTHQPMREEKISKTLNPNGFQKANWELAVKRVNQKKNQFYKGKQVNLFVDLDHFKMYGTGIFLFFSFFKGLVIIFLLLSIISIIPCMINYYQGNGLKDISSSMNYYFAKTTIGNYDSSTDVFSSEHKLFNTIPGMVGITFFIIYYFVWLYRSNSLAVQVRKQVKLKSYNVLQLIDPPAEARQQDIMKFMSQFGKVAEIAAVNNYSQTIDLSKKIYEKEIEIKQLELKAENEKATQYKEEIEEKKMDIEQTYKQLVLYQDDIKQEIIKYYITFSKMQEREKALKQLQPHLKSTCSCFRDPAPQKYLLLGQRVNVIACNTEPGQIIWQNQHVTWKSRWIRSIIQFIILLTLISFGFLFIQFMNLLTPSTTLAVNSSNYTSTTILLETNSTIVSAWCLANQKQALSSSGSSLYNICYPYIKDYYLKILITIGIAIGVVVMKQLLKIIVIKIAKFQRYTTHTQQSKDIIQNLFLTYTTTTVLITLLFQAKLLGISFKNVLISFIKLNTLSQNSASLNQYEDFISSWYLDIGYQICINWVVMIIHPFLTMPLVLYLLEKWKYYSASSQQIQAKMQAKIQPAEFQLEDHYANVLMITIVSLTFAAGMPIIIIIGFFALLTRYLYCKYIFIRHSKIPKTYDQSLDTKMTRILPYGILLYFLFGIWMFGVSSIFKRDSSFAEKWTNSLSSYALLKQISFILQRIFGTWYFSALFAIFFILFAFKIFFYNLIISRFVENNKQIVQLQFNPNLPGQQSVNEEIGQISAKNLCDSYKIQNNPDYKEILQIREAKSKYVVRAVVKKN